MTSKRLLGFALKTPRGMTEEVRHDNTTYWVQYLLEQDNGPDFPEGSDIARVSRDCDGCGLLGRRVSVQVPIDAQWAEVRQQVDRTYCALCQEFIENPNIIDYETTVRSALQSREQALRSTLARVFRRTVEPASMSTESLRAAGFYVTDELPRCLIVKSLAPAQQLAADFRVQMRSEPLQCMGIYVGNMYAVPIPCAADGTDIVVALQELVDRLRRLSYHRGYIETRGVLLQPA